VVHQIFEHLPPGDLIQLSRVNKAIHQILHSEGECRTVWLRCLQREGAPAAPEGMTEPAWANLLFGGYCSVCRTFRENWTSLING
ncbi:hypothetical protein OF83DRAFT_1073266, partial [Amylostereum chailletii]